MADQGTAPVNLDDLAQQSGSLGATPTTPQAASNVSNVNADGTPNLDALAQQSGALNADTSSSMPNQRPSSSDQFDQAQKAGGYTEPSEADGKPITYLIQKPDENYSDFMKRAVAHGKTVTQQQMNEESNQPKKIVDAAVVRPAEIAAGASSVMAAVGEVPALVGAAKNQIYSFLASQSPELFGEEAVKATLKKYAAQGVAQALKGAGYAGGAGAAYAAFEHLFGSK